MHTNHACLINSLNVRYRTSLSIFLLFFFIIASLGLFSSRLNAQSSATLNSSYCDIDEPIKFADLAWESAAFSTQLLKNIIEKGYGCVVELAPGSAAALEVALTENDIQVIAELWDGRTEIIEKGIKVGKIHVVGDTLEGGAEQGWYVPDYLIKGDATLGLAPLAPNLNSVEQLGDYSHLFKSPDKPKLGRFYNCPAGWICETFNSSLLKVYQLDTKYENFRTGTGAALEAAISSAYERREPIFFYYWQPAGLMAKYNFFRLGTPPFDAACWEQVLINSDKACATDFVVSHLRVAVSTPFFDSHPALIELFKQYTLPPALLNEIILRMSEQQLNGKQMAELFMREQAEHWRQWIPIEVADRLTREYDPAQQQSMVASGFFPSCSMAKEINHYLAVVVRHSGATFRAVSNALLHSVILPLERLFSATPPWVMLGLLTILSWHATRRFSSTLLFTISFFFIGTLGLWDKLMQTLALVVLSTLLSILIGIPVGVVMARSYLVRRLIMPLLDVMQTMPSFVYLIPVLMLFGLGKVPALFATVIYAVAPLIRLTSLGIRQVDHELVEAVQSFGVTRWQMLRLLSLPLARPSIMAGINQTTMMALSMVVVASMIGAQGLGEDVLAGIQTLDIGRGLQAGVAIVILAIVMDRITQSYGESRRSQQKIR